MIKDNTIDAVYPLVEKFHKKGVVVSPISHTPLASLAAASSLPPVRGLTTGDTIEDAADTLIRASRAAGPDGLVQHDLVMDEIVDVVSKTVQNNLNLARSVVNPVVKDTAERAQVLMDAAVNAKTHQLSVRPVFYHDIWGTPTLSEMVSRYQETPVRDERLYIDIPAPTMEDGFLSMLRTGASRFDGIIEDWAKSLGPEMVESAFRAVFQPSGGAKILDYLKPYNRDSALLVHLFARRLLQDVPEDIGVGLSEYREYMSTILSQSGRAVVSVIRRREQEVRRRRLILSYPYNTELIASQPQVVEVNGDLYNQWLKEGGSPEALFGSAVTSKELGYQALLDQKESFEKAWERKERVLDTYRRQERFNHARDALHGAVTEQINGLEEDNLVVDRKVLHERLQQEVGKLSGRFYEDWYCAARKMVCCVIFPHTDAYRILTAIDEVSKDNPDLDVREAALLATVDIVGAWVAKLCKVDYVTPPSA